MENKPNDQPKRYWIYGLPGKPYIEAFAADSLQEAEERMCKKHGVKRALCVEITEAQLAYTNHIMPILREDKKNGKQ